MTRRLRRPRHRGKAAVPQAPPTPEKARRVCRSEKVTASLTRVRRACLTQEEWDHIEGRSRDEVGKMQRRAAGAQSCRYEDPNLMAPCY
jgi:hypothetical protein